LAHFLSLKRCWPSVLASLKEKEQCKLNDAFLSLKRAALRCSTQVQAQDEEALS